MLWRVDEVTRGDISLVVHEALKFCAHELVGTPDILECFHVVNTVSLFLFAPETGIDS